MKKSISLILCILLLASLLTACQKSAEETPNTSNDTPQTSSVDSEVTSTDTNTEQPTESPTLETVDFTTHETFTIWLQADPNDYYADYSENPVIQFLNRKFNVTLEFQQPAAGTESDSLSLMFGTAEYTDVIDMNRYSGSIQELYSDGVLVNIAEYLDYMPNLKKLLDADSIFRKNLSDDNGRILALESVAVLDELIWGGLVYRKDILDTMTGGNIAFPSGNANPTTVEDWDYMLPLFKQYFEAAGMAEYAPLIIPSNAMFGFGEIASGFGTHTNYFVEDGKVKYGPMEDGFYNYVKKLKEWYDAGYIYKDFASRTNDPFYLPNTSLTYGGAAGIWYGLQSQLADAMSMPEYGLIFDVQALSSPIDTANGVTEAAPFSRSKHNDFAGVGYAISTTCKNIPKLLTVLDYLYTQEGSDLYTHGLTKEQGADTDPVYAKAGLQEGAYWLDAEGKIVTNPLFVAEGGTVEHDPFVLNRMPTLRNNADMMETAPEEYIKADGMWGAYTNTKQNNLPTSLSRPEAEDKLLAERSSTIIDYVGTTVSKFIIGTEPLDDAAWLAFKAQLVSYGIEDNIRIQQEAYDRYINR